MKKLNQRLLMMIITFLCILVYTIPAMAAVNRDEQAGPGVTPPPAEEEVQPEVPSYQPLGTFVTTAYCSCSRCSGNGYTFAGTVPTVNHTISADLNVFPLGTKLMINDVVYTVEDKGSSVKGNKLDIYFDSHAAALQYGVRNAEVYVISE